MTPTPDNTNKHAPPTRAPIMASYNLTPSVQKKSYKDIAAHNQSHSEVEVINPTYTPIDWENKMEEIRNTTIKECMQQTNMMIEASEKKQMDKLNKLENTIATNKETNDTTIATLIALVTDLKKSQDENFKILNSQRLVLPISPNVDQKTTLTSALMQDPKKLPTLNEKKREVEQNTQLVSQSPEKKLMSNQSQPYDTPNASNIHNEQDV